MFVDRVRIEVVAGDGGRGSGSFRREKYVPRGGPDGGDGGAGGSVILRAAAGIDSLAALAHRAQWRAGHGESGGPANCHGRSAADLVLEVPPGTIVTDEQTGLVLKDLATAGDWIVAARGGSGGFGNVHFKSSTNRAPRTTTPGGKGEARRLALELKVIADVGLVGLPNAGKSTLLSRLSRARPQIADYAFTTKSPMLGIVAVDRDRSFVLADLPGLIEGAHAGTGLGHEFLRHVERAGILVHVVEPAPLDGSDPVANHRTIRAELAAYDPDLARRPEITIVSKAELPTAAEVRDRLEASLDRPVLAVSAVTGTGLDHLVRAVVRELDRPRTTSAQPVAAVADVAAAAPGARGVPAEPRAVAAPGESAAEGPAGAGDDALPACRDDAMPACRDDAMLACRDDAMAPGAVTLGDTVLVADVGNTRIKLAAVADWSGGPGDGRLPRLIHRQDLSSRDFHPDNLERWLAQAARGTAVLLVGSVHDAAAARLEAAVAEVSATRYRALRQRRIGHADLPLEVRLPEPHRVGIDRLAAATAAALIRPADQPAIVIDCGTAATVGCLAADGAFLGGAILAGPALLARALAEGTSRLPEVESLGTEPPPALPGRNTHEAIAAGIGWGIRGAIRELLGQARLAVGGEPTVFLTGGWRGAVRDVLPGVVELPDLVLLGLALAAPRACRR